jgi:glycosyltransferase involved in cell wall biosynthesis
MIPIISIIVPNYNHAQFLPKRLESIFNQSYQNFELILLDDCSTDSSWEILKKFKHHPKVAHCLRNESNSGSPFKQWKKGLDLAKSDLIWIAESDDCADSEFLAEMVPRLGKRTSIAYCRTAYIDESDRPISGKFPNWNINDKLNLSRWSEDHFSAGKSEILNFLMFRNTIVNASSVLFYKPSSFPEEILSMRYCGDWYFWIYLLQSGNVTFCSLKLNYFRIHKGSSQPKKSSNSEFIRIKEIFKCIQYSRRVLHLRFPRRIDFINYADLAKYYAWNFRKLNLSPSTLLESPPFLIPLFLFHYLKHVMKSALNTF